MAKQTVENNDTGSLKAPGATVAVGDLVQITGEKTPRKVTYIMGAGDRQHLCFRGTGKVPTGPVEFEILAD